MFIYSMAVAILPDPTVLPPSRIFVTEIKMILLDFRGFWDAFFFDMHLVSEVFQLFVIMGRPASLSILFCYLSN